MIIISYLVTSLLGLMMTDDITEVELNYSNNHVIWLRAALTETRDATYQNVL